jgi:ubiquitin carboxyl-terminal hydrolase 5/13
VENPTKLAIGTSGGFITETKYDIIKENQIVIITDTGPQFFKLPNNELPEFVMNVADAIINHGGMKNKMSVDTWDSSNEIFVSKYAEALIQLKCEKSISQDPTTWKCEQSGDTENLWLNLSTGYIGGGRKNWDGTGGSGAALQHFRDTGSLYPLCVKLGTITANSADVWSYADDEDTLVLDPKLPIHLAHWGINIMGLEKTDKSMTEMEVELNMKYDWNRILESGEELEVIKGAGYIGLKNIGSSCYLNAVMQTILSVKEVL